MNFNLWVLQFSVLYFADLQFVVFQNPDFAINPTSLELDILTKMATLSIEIGKILPIGYYHYKKDF